MNQIDLVIVYGVQCYNAIRELLDIKSVLFVIVMIVFVILTYFQSQWATCGCCLQYLCHR